MKRLKHLLLGMEPSSQTYWEIYEGRAIVCPPPAGEIAPETVSDPTYWHEDIAFTLTQTNKHALDQPTVTIAIPATRLGIEISKAAEKAAADFCLREIAPVFDELNAMLYNRKRPDKENGKYILHTPGSEVLVRNTAFFTHSRAKDYQNGGGCVIRLKEELSRPPEYCLCVRLKIQLPYKKIKKTLQMLCRDLPQAALTFCERFDAEKLAQAVALSQNQTKIRAFIKESEFCAFIADGSILPRGKDGGPLPNAVPFAAPPFQRVTVCGVPGFGVRRGVTVITGGGYSGKSTVLDAIAAGIYDHIGGDGRELVLTDETAVSIAAEDGRCVQNVNIAPFIRWIPGGDPAHFSTGHASGSTSQATNIIEAIEAGSRLLLIDEDRSATNFMIRDKMMKELVEKEPILPFTDRVNELSRNAGVSTVLVIGGSGE